MHVWGPSWQAFHSFRETLEENLQTLLPKSHRMKAKKLLFIHPVHPYQNQFAVQSFCMVACCH